jgi:ubiquinone/menaquinone biosynthesis C-methylase UbiE
MKTMTEPSGWNSFARTNASDRWRRQSAMMGTPLTELVVREARIEPGMKVLDVACGTGEPAISVATVLHGTGEVVATDISPAPLKIAQQRARQRGLTNIRFQIADVHKLPLADSTFDRVTSRLGLMFFADLPQALREIHRVLKPGARFTAAVWGPMQQPYFETTIGAVLRQCPELKLPESGMAMFKFGDTGTLARALKDAGFAEAHDELREVEWTWSGLPEDVWDYFQAVTIPFGPLLKAVPESKRPEVNRCVVEQMRKFCRDGCVQFGGRFNLSWARK